MSPTLADAESRDISGLMTRLLVQHLDTHCRDGVLAAVLKDAGDERSFAQLCDESGWSSHGQFRALLEAAAVHLGGVDALREIGRHVVVVTDSSADYTDMLQSLGSVASLYAQMGATSRVMAPIVEVVATEVGPTEWLLRQRFVEGFEPYPEYCAYMAGLTTLTPRIFGYPPAEVIEEECECRGADWCVMRVRWEATDSPERRAEYFESRAQLLELRLAALQNTLGVLVGTEDVDVLLSHIVDSAASAVRAPGYVLALSDRGAQSAVVRSVGIDEADAAAIAERLLSGALTSDDSHLVVEVASTRRSYGQLAAINPIGTGFFAQERVSLQAYARFAAAALDSAEAIEDARREASTSRALLEQLHEAQSHLVEGKKLEAIGSLAAGVAHEINTPIQFIGDNLTYIRFAFDDLSTLADDDPARLEHLAEIPVALEQSLEGVHRVAEIVRAMKGFAHGGDDALTWFDVNQAVADTVLVCRSEWKYVADLDTNFDTNLPRVEGAPGPIKQVILNIVVNAAHAIADRVGPDGKGQITITTSCVDDVVRIVIADTGGGIPESIQDRVFDQFFTTKEVGRGSGQGLAISRRVVNEQHGGRLWFESQPDQGTTFYIDLPSTGQT